MIVYLVCNDDYEDGSPEVAFSTREKAQAILDAGFDGRIVELEIDELVPAIDGHKLLYSVELWSRPGNTPSYGAALKLYGPQVDGLPGRYSRYTWVRAGSREEAIERVKEAEEANANQ